MLPASHVFIRIISTCVPIQAIGNIELSFRSLLPFVSEGEELTELTSVLRTELSRLSETTAASSFRFAAVT